VSNPGPWPSVMNQIFNGAPLRRVLGAERRGIGTRARGRRVFDELLLLLLPQPAMPAAKQTVRTPATCEAVARY